MRSISHVLFAAVVLATTGASAQTMPPSVLPGVAADSARVAVDGTAGPWRGVVLVQTEVGLHCSGALVGPRLVLTAAHCLLGRGTGRLVQPGSVHVLTGYARGAYAGHARAVSLETGMGEDWALLTLDQALGTADRVLPLATPVPGAAAMLGGYEQDRAQVLVADVACTVAGLVREGAGHVLLRHSCAGTRGVSGAPLLMATPGVGWAVAGVAVMAERGRAGGYAVPIDAIRARILANGEKAR